MLKPQLPFPAAFGMVHSPHPVAAMTGLSARIPSGRVGLGPPRVSGC